MHQNTAIQFIGESNDAVREALEQAAVLTESHCPAGTVYLLGFCSKAVVPRGGRTQLLLQDTHSIKTEVLRH